MVTDTQSQRSAAAIGSAIPVFNVADLAASIRHYVDVLRFEVDWTDPGGVASVSRGACTLFLCEGDQGLGRAWTWIGVGDVDGLHAELATHGAKVRLPPTNYYWACEMQIEDLDGNVLRMGSDTKPDEPFGPWLNMRGERWIQSAGGEWTRLKD